MQSHGMFLHQCYKEHGLFSCCCWSSGVNIFVTNTYCFDNKGIMYSINWPSSNYRVVIKPLALTYIHLSLWPKISYVPSVANDVEDCLSYLQWAGFYQLVPGTESGLSLARRPMEIHMELISH